MKQYGFMLRRAPLGEIKALLIVALALLLSINCAFCYDTRSERNENGVFDSRVSESKWRSHYDHKKVTEDGRIKDALKVLEETRSENVLESVFERDKKGRNTQIIFYDLGMISYEYKKHYAMTSTDELGQNYIIINAKYRNAPKEALAALIAHESSHKLEKADLKEEIGATVAEAVQWKKSIELNPLLKESNNPLIDRLNNLVKLYDENGEDAISKSITGNEFYKLNLL